MPATSHGLATYLRLDPDYADLLSQPREQSPEHKLWTSVLLQAIHDAKKGSPSDIWWIFHAWNSKPYSFNWTCANLNIDSDELRNTLRKRWKNINLQHVAVARICKK